MARPKNSDGDARQRLVEAAGRGFRIGGFGGAGAVDLALAESALTGLLAWLEAGPAGAHLDVAL